MPSEVVRHLAAAGGVADVNGFHQIEMRRQGRKVVGIVIHVMAVAGLAGPAVAAAVMGDDSIAVTQEEQHLRVPVIGRQRPAMAEYDGLTGAPVLVVDFSAVSGLDCRHGRTPCWTRGMYPGPVIPGRREDACPGMTKLKPRRSGECRH